MSEPWTPGAPLDVQFFGEDEDVANAARLWDAAPEMAALLAVFVEGNQGRHEGPCRAYPDDESFDNRVDGCYLHIQASEARRQDAAALLSRIRGDSREAPEG